MNALTIRIIYLVFVSILISCANKKPDWFMNPPISNDIIYGIGVSNYNFEDARKNALNDISSQIQVNISSDFNNNVYENSSGLNMEITNSNLQIKSNDILITNYRSEKQESKDGIYYVMLSIDRNILTVQTSNKIDSIMQDLEIMRNSLIKEKDQIKQIKNIKDIKDKMQNLQKQITLINGLDLKYDTTNKLEEVENIKKNIDRIMENISFFIDSDNQEITDLLSSALSENGYNVAKNNSKNNIIIKVNSSFKEFIVFSYFTIESRISILFSNSEKGNTFQKIFLNRNTSAMDYEKAKIKAIESLRKEVPDLMKEFLSK